MDFESWLKAKYPNRLHAIHATFSASDMMCAYLSGANSAQEKVSALENENALLKQRIMTLEVR